MDPLIEVEILSLGEVALIVRPPIASNSMLTRESLWAPNLAYC